MTSLAATVTPSSSGGFSFFPERTWLSSWVSGSVALHRHPENRIRAAATPRPEFPPLPSHRSGASKQTRIRGEPEVYRGLLRTIVRSHCLRGILGSGGAVGRNAGRGNVETTAGKQQQGQSPNLLQNIPPTSQTLTTQQDLGRSKKRSAVETIQLRCHRAHAAHPLQVGAHSLCTASPSPAPAT